MTEQLDDEPGRAYCRVPDCRWVSREFQFRDMAGCAASWHIYEKHPETWRDLFGDRPPNDPDPRTDAGLAEIFLRNVLVLWRPTGDAGGAG